MISSFVTSLALLLSALGSAVQLAGSGSPWKAGSGSMLAADLVVLATIALVGMLVAASRWARRLGLGVTGTVLALSVGMPVSGWWWSTVVLAGVALAGLAGTGMRGVVRLRPAASGPPARAVALTLGMFVMPGLVAGVQPRGLSTLDWITAAGFVVVAIAYSKAVRGSLALVRLGIPLVTALGAWAAGFPAGLGIALGGAFLVRLAWSVDARVAVVPITERGTAVPIPPELAPEDVLDAAGIDRRGRPKETP